MKAFNLEAAKAGAPVQTRDGRPARIVCFDRKNTDGYKLVVLIEEKTESVRLYTETGVFLISAEADEYDLVMAPVKKSGWFNIDPEDLYSYKEQALANVKTHQCTVYVEWEE